MRPSANHVARNLRARSAPRPGFTLIELIVAVAIIGVLLAVLLPAIRSTVAAARSFKCQMSQRSVGFDFQVFADDTLHGQRGDDDGLASGRAFHLETFVESQLGIDEFWAYPGETLHQIPDAAGRDPMRCVEVKGPLDLRRNEPCTGAAISPPQNISFGFNIRFQRNSTTAQWVILTSRVLEGDGGESPGTIPLLWDVDGAQAHSMGRLPLFSGPTLDSPVFYGNTYWFPGMRHNGALNVAFLDGHVASSRKPLNEPTWAWGFEPGR